MELINIKNMLIDGGGRELFTLKDIKVFSGDKIGIIGDNGSGKTTLLNTLIKNLRKNISFYYLTQLNEDASFLSKGEMKKEKINMAFNLNPAVLFFDEADNALDIKSIEYLIERIKRFNGTCIAVTHNRYFLKNICNKLWVIEDGDLTVFNGGLDFYIKQKEIKKIEYANLYQNYKKEEKRLKDAMKKAQNRSDKIKKTPSRMGNSEARLHKMGDQKAKKSINRQVKRLESRINGLDRVKKESPESSIKITLPEKRELYNQSIIKGENICKKYGEKIVFNNLSFTLTNKDKIALLGSNGKGKTTLLDMIYNKEQGIIYAKNVRVGYLKQDFSQLNLDGSILENINKISVRDSLFNRNILARLLFKGDDVNKKCIFLSGGEKMRVLLAMLFVSDMNVLLMDEPTSYLDLSSIKAIEEALIDYDGTVIFSSHDKSFINNVATGLWQINNYKIDIL